MAQIPSGHALLSILFCFLSRIRLGKSTPSQEIWSEIRNCAEQNNLTTALESFSEMDFTNLPETLNASCTSFPAFFECAQDAFVKVFKLWNPINPVATTQVDAIYHAICDEDNREAALCYFSPEPDTGLPLHKGAERSCRQEQRETWNEKTTTQKTPTQKTESQDAPCERKRALLECAMPKVSAGGGGQKTAEIMKSIYSAEVQTEQGVNCTVY